MATAFFEGCGRAWEAQDIAGFVDLFSATSARPRVGAIRRRPDASFAWSSTQTPNSARPVLPPNASPGNGA